jgi:hypothetical protein
MDAIAGIANPLKTGDLVHLTLDPDGVAMLGKSSD